MLNHGQPWAPVDVTLLKQCVEDGMTIKETAWTTGRSSYAVITKVRDLGLRFKRRRGVPKYLARNTSFPCRFQLTMDEEMQAALYAEAERQKASVTDVIRTFIDWGLETTRLAALDE